MLLLLRRRQSKIQNHLIQNRADPSFPLDKLETLFRAGRDVDKSIALVVDSFIKTMKIDFTGASVVIDEAEQFLESLLIGKTHISKARGNISSSNKSYLYAVTPLLPKYYENIYSAIKQKYSRELELNNPEKLRGGSKKVKNQAVTDFEEGVKQTDNNINSPGFTPNSNCYGVRDTDAESGMKENPRENDNFEEKEEPENNNLIGREVTYMHPVDWEQRGIIERIEDAVYWVKDLITNRLIPCLDYQVEFS